MSIHVALSHRTEYHYDRPVGLSSHVVRLRPAPHCRTPILSYALRVRPSAHFINWQQDPQGNYLARLVFPEKAETLLVEVDLVAEMATFNPFDFFLEPAADRFPFPYEPWLRKELTPFLDAAPAGPLLRDWLGTVDRRPTRTVDFLVELNRRLSQAVRYVIRLEPGVQSPEQTLEHASGSCRDSAWLLVQILRSLGLAARFVSGYLIQLVPDVKALDGPVGPSNDFTDLHAWTEVYLPGAGWIGLDPTSGLLAGEGHIPLAATPDPAGAAPVTGLVDECKTTFTHQMTLQRIFESPRVTKPYTEAQWHAIDALGRAVDRELRAGDVRLTMGGEPTFVSIDDMDGAEWNTSAGGEKKRELAGALIRRLRNHYAPGGLLHDGQGKWYPGESLPRWSLGCWWRRDGEPLWRNDTLIADDRIDYGYRAAEAERFVSALADRLGVEAAHATAGYEDAWYYLWKERRLPVNVDPLKSNLSDEEERARLARVFEQGLHHIVGYALPLRRASVPGGDWQSGPWNLRADRLFLIPGDSPMGYRLPLESLPWIPEDEYPRIYPADPFAVALPLPPHQPALAADRAGTRRAAAAMPAGPLIPAGGRAVRTAVCVEPRHGRLYVFMPPVAATEDYLDLVAAVEDTADALGMPVVIEGEAPPRDSRLNHVRVTPDPGVIEVNLNPVHTWEGLVEQATTLYEEARLSRLGTEKFMIDGRHTGTGGGNHIVIGGPTASDSPVLRRPDLLRSLVGYWQNHPSLSYLFSGLFIGPTSQHPRVDEARTDSLYELQIAFNQIPEGAACPPWLVDRIFRHVLTDATGNTHRTEFCIDKLYAPESSEGRRGLVELRAFEMPPHARMSLAGQLLLRTLIARFWKSPYRQDLVPWGTMLHDRFMLPHFVAQDAEDVVVDLQRHGYAFERDWLVPHLEFRFPLFGSATVRGVHLELRQALEPWNVLGEEPGPGGTVRYVDSSVERLQVRVTGITGSRHVVTCNGRRVPLHPTGTTGEFIAGVRYRAWRPPSCLHPTIPVQAPLVFDIVDRWNERSIGGCVYHVMHAGGRSFETVPVNAFEAESRRLSRFSAIGHTPGTMGAVSEEPNPDLPLTLDLRRSPSSKRTVEAPLGLMR